MALWVASFGIIPARAGSTLAHHIKLLLEQDHPRSCGEHIADALGTDVQTGSSPLVRGALHDLQDEQRHRRIIPARAGSTIAERRNIEAYWDHPRSCGEHKLVT